MNPWAHGKEWLDFLAMKAGTRKWFVGHRLTQRKIDKGYEAAISPRKFKEYEAEFLASEARSPDESRLNTNATNTRG